VNQPLWIYLTIPVAAASIGYVTKLLMIEMIFRPLEFKGPVDPWLGWQGQVPRNAAKMAVTAVRTLQGNLLEPRELIDRFDPDELVAEIEAPLYAAIADITEEIALQYQPAVWGAMPDAARQALIGRVQRQSPRIIGRLLADVREHLELVFDFEHTVVTTLVRDKAKLTELFRRMGGDTFGFMRRAGLIFGAAIGVVQAVALYVTGVELLLPVFGLITGGLTDWLALQMIFRPARPGRFVFLPWHGRFHKLRPQISRDYAAMMATDILTPAALIEGVLTGPMSDRLYKLIEQEVHRTIDAQIPALARPFVTTVRREQLDEIKRGAAARVLDHLPAHMHLAAGYADRTLDLQNLIAERMDLMTDHQYEGLLRPIFKDDEWIVVVLGAALGFICGELQLHLMLR
jgi:uncharacterized membrane protein YheB (UPF0754 family)